MRAWLRRVVISASLLALLAVPATSAADHVSISGSVGAVVTEIEPARVEIKVTWNLTCNGASGGASYRGDLYMLDDETGVERYLGGIASASGEVITHEPRTGHDRQVHATLRAANCFENSSAHGSQTVEFGSSSVVVPAKEPGGGGGGGGGGNGGGGGGNGGGGNGGPTDPLVTGGCSVQLLGTPQADNLVGTDAGELILALGGDDLVTAGNGHDCLIGEDGNDRLEGQDGSDRLTGGKGNDLLIGGPGKNFYDAGGGKDRVKAKNGKSETVRCGPGKDRARVDRSDHVSSCEKTSGA
jgi:hemolysin type calcium-binding protein